MDRVERRLDATLKIVQTGMKMIVKMEKENRDFRDETRYAIKALIAAQMRTDAVVAEMAVKITEMGVRITEMGQKITEVGAKIDRLTDALLQPPSNGGSRRGNN